MLKNTNRLVNNPSSNVVLVRSMNSTESVASVTLHKYAALFSFVDIDLDSMLDIVQMRLGNPIVSWS